MYKNIAVILLLGALLIATGCVKNTKKNAQLTKKTVPTKLTQRHKEGSRELETFLKLLSSDPHSLIKVSQLVSTNPILYNVSGTISDKEPNHEYIFRIGDKCIRKGIYSKENGNYSIETSQKEMRLSEDYTGVFVENTKFSLMLDGKPLYADGISLPRPVKFKITDLLKGPEGTLINWEVDPTNKFGLGISVIGFDEDGTAVACVYDLIPDEKGSLKIGYLLGEFTKCTKFTIEGYRGAYYNTDLPNPDILLIYSQCASGISY